MFVYGMEPFYVSFMSIDGLIDDIIRPMLLAAGYHPGGVAKLYSLVEPEGGVDDTEMDSVK